jgi:hypothetical protein
MTTYQLLQTPKPISTPAKNRTCALSEQGYEAVAPFRPRWGTRSLVRIRLEYFCFFFVPYLLSFHFFLVSGYLFPRLWVTFLSPVGHFFLASGSLFPRLWVTFSSPLGHFFLASGSPFPRLWVTFSSPLGRFFLASWSLFPRLWVTFLRLWFTFSSPQGHFFLTSG